MGDKTAEDLHGLIKGSTLQYISKCGHLPWIERQEEFRKVIASFFTTKQGESSKAHFVRQ